jgi:SNF2-related domain/SNF2 Helicase protein/Helicase conserved C-terminal domain
MNGVYMHPQELSVVIRPDGLLLEWTDTDDTYNEPSQHFQQELYRCYHAAPETWLLFLSFSDPDLHLAPALAFWRDVTVRFAETLVHLPDLEDLRDHATVELGDDDVRQWLAIAPLCPGAEYLNRDLLLRIWSSLHDSFRRLISAYDGTVEAFIHAYRPTLQLTGRIFFHLVENTKGDAPFAFLATYSTHMGGDGASRHLPLKYALQEYRHDRDKLLELLGTVYRAAHDSKLLPQLLENGEIFHPLGWEAHEAYTFLQEVPLYEQSGILCRIPNWWSTKSAGARLRISIGNAQPTFVGMDAVLQCVPSLFINGVPITAEEARHLLHESEGLALIKNKWVAVDKENLQQTLAAYEKARTLLEDGGLTLREALALQLSPEKLLGDEHAGVDIGVSYGEWFEDVTRKLLNASLVTAMTPSASFRATLRPYQQAGLNWLGFLDSLGFGACLADDMGLGKTIQVLAFLSVKKVHHITSLLVVPASLIANWSSEIDRFYPELVYHIAHPSSMSTAQKTALAHDDLSRYDLVITTYAMVQRDELLQTFPWDYVILDEAQAIKNPGTKQARAVKKLPANNRIMLTGTPVENRLSDLWSLFDFLNPGLLGNLKEFKTFTKTLKRDTAGYGRLRTVISPYILRRLKTDKSIIDDLPDKVEMKTFASLTTKQIVLYRDLVDEIETILETSEGIQRKGLILSSLMRFKQLCNHPDQFLGTGAFEEQHSGKFQRLREICEIVQEKREKMLIFTQFKELTAALHDFLATIFGRDGVVLHGSVAVSKRKALVDAFQRKDTDVPFLVLSLKAGGVGLNLTEANHVVHFDRWWNPAVENQATDRAFRIGQQKNVVVHKFITQGTVEEKIDAMLEAKSRLASAVIAASGEGWITELENDQLRELFRLSLS